MEKVVILIDTIIGYVKHAEAYTWGITIGFKAVFGLLSDKCLYAMEADASYEMMRVLFL